MKNEGHQKFVLLLNKQTQICVLKKSEKKMKERQNVILKGSSEWAGKR